MSLPTLHILHLERREDRLQQLLRQMEWNKVPYIIWEGYDEPENVKRAITRGFKKVIQYAKDNNLTSINYGEDDLIFTNKDSYKYFNSQIREEADLTCGVLYHGEIDSDFRILNGMSGTQTLLNVNSKFYQTILDLPDDIHIDRTLGSMAFQYKYYVVNPQVCYQSGGKSDNLKRAMYYWPYMEGKEFFGQENKKCVDGMWVDK